MNVKLDKALNILKILTLRKTLKRSEYFKYPYYFLQSTYYKFFPTSR